MDSVVIRYLRLILLVLLLQLVLGVVIWLQSWIITDTAEVAFVPTDLTDAELPADDRGPDLERLRRVKLPKKASKRQVRDYVSKVMQITKDQTWFSDRDPQIEMLVRIGPQHVDILIDQLADTDSYDGYIVSALNQLVGPEHKQLVLDSLRGNKELVIVVIAKGWLEDASEILKRAFRLRPDYLPVEWVQAVARLEHPETYDDLKDYFARGTNKEHTYKAIATLPDFDLQDAVETMWRHNRALRDPWDATSAAKTAARYGITDALSQLVNIACREPMNEHHRHESEEALQEVWMLTGRTDSGDELARWFEQNKEQLVFQPESRTYILEAR